jgi:arylsulfatase A-like enzyme
VFTDIATSVIRRETRAHHPFFLNVAFLAPHSAGPQEEAPGPQPAGIGRGEMDNRLAVPPARYRSIFRRLSIVRGPAFNEADVSDKPGFLQHGKFFQPMTAQDEADIDARYQARVGSLMAVDDAVARIVATLKDTGALQNTVIMFTSDNGFFYGEHRIRGGKYFVYDPATRVPLLMRGPGIARGAVRTQMVSNIDLAPTILALAHARPLRLPDGRSLTPLLGPHGDQVTWDRALLFASGANNEYPAVYSAIRTDRYLYVEYSTGDRELYDLVHDPDELQSLHRDPALKTVREQLARHLAALRTCRGDTCR